MQLEEYREIEYAVRRI